jgi:hypothetical protein|tara:strand:+ start:440 stop:799 length:360 start_codon:yes stop_codon:yes gene_type:complete
MDYQQPRRRIRDRPRSAQQDSLDKQILCLHKAMADKLIANHDYLCQVMKTIENRYECGKMRHGAYLFWSSLLEYIDQPELFISTLLEDSSQLRKYRRQTPLVGILTEQERQVVLDGLIF